ncbi:MAG: hypothetical protein JNJ41_01150 [Bacteroidia bacterium]|nr:hypothetical protein [Bacteroidia bacterium]
MKDIYLTTTLKDKYMKDFTENVLHGQFWPLDEGLPEILTDINKNPKVQTLYSKKCQCVNWGDEDSYFEFCYSQDLELNIFQSIIPNLIYEFNADTKSRLGYLFQHPKLNPNFHADKPKKGIGCIDDVNYFNVNNIKIILHSTDKQTHDDFWTKIQKTFGQLGL